MTIKPFDLGKKLHIEGILVEHAHRILWVHRGDEFVACITNGAQMAGGNVTANTDYSKIFDMIFPLKKAWPGRAYPLVDAETTRYSCPSTLRVIPMGFHLREPLLQYRSDAKYRPFVLSIKIDLANPHLFEFRASAFAFLRRFPYTFSKSGIKQGTLGKHKYAFGGKIIFQAGSIKVRNLDPASVTRRLIYQLTLPTAIPRQ